MKKILYLFVLLLMVACEKNETNNIDKPNIVCSNNEIIYTTKYGYPIELAVTEGFGGNLVSHVYEEGYGKITFDNDVVCIPYKAFSGCDTLTSIALPECLNTVGHYAFSGCSILTEFKGVLAADGGRCLVKEGTLIAYAEASGTTYTILDSVTTIGEDAFYGCTSLTSVTIGNSVTTIGEYAFYDCRSLTSVTIPDSVTTIGGSAFSGCESLTSVTIGNSVTTIGKGVFADCSNLAEFKGKFAADGGRCLIKDNTLIAYANASGTTYTIPDSVTTIGDQAFYLCSSLTSVTIGDSVTTIGDYAFNGCSSLTSVTIPDSVTTIGDEAFGCCSSLISVTIGDSVTTIGRGAFYYCSSLTSVTIPDSVTTIGDYAFSYCESLTSVYCKAITPPTLDGSNVFVYNKSGRKIYVPAELVDDYKSAENWSDYAADIVGYDFDAGEVVE